LCDFLRIIDMGCDLRRIIRNSFIADMWKALFIYPNCFADPDPK